MPANRPNCKLAVLYVFALALPAQVFAQSLTRIRIEGPDAVPEESLTYYQVIAEFDNGEEFDVTLSATLFLDPGTHASIGVFGDFDAFPVTVDEIEIIHAYYTFGPDTASDTHDVTINNLLPARHALRFDGTNDIVIIPASETLEPTHALTIECWAKGLPGGESRAVMIRKAANADAGFVLRWQFQGDPHVYFQLAKSNLSEEIWLTDPTNNSEYENEWHHFAAVYSEAGDFARLYVDGLPVREEPGYGSLQHTGDLWFGETLTFNDEAFRGCLDEVRFWNVARTECQIQRTMQRQLRGDEQGLVGYWRLDEGMGQSLSDATLNGHHGMRGIDADPVGDPSDPLWKISDAPLNQPAFPPPVWSTPTLVSEVASNDDWSVSISSDELEIYICSERDSFASTDVYHASRPSIFSPFSTPVVVPELSIPGFNQHDISGNISQNGLRFYFTRHVGHGPGDFYLAERPSPTDPWGTPTAITSLNSDAREYGIAISSDELFAVFTSRRDGTDKLWQASRAAITLPWTNLQPICLGGGFLCPQRVHDARWAGPLRNLDSTGRTP